MPQSHQKIVVTGVSSGLGRELVKKQIARGNRVWGIARRKHLLETLRKEVQSDKFIYSSLDLSKRKNWRLLLAQMNKRKFIPDVVIFNAAVSDNDLEKGLDLNVTKKMFSTNFFGVLMGVEELLKVLSRRTVFIAISSSSALKGNDKEGVGYGASKAALSLAFETLYQKYRYKHLFKLVYFGPIDTGMNPFKRLPFLTISVDSATKCIIRAMDGEKAIYECPKFVFLFFRLLRLFPSGIYFFILSIIGSSYLKMKNVN